MGHSEMLLAVAGLDEKTLDERTKRLAGTDWSGFPPEERAAYFFAKKMSRAPWDVTDEDVDQLVRHFGLPRALDVIWWACRCHHMTRVADAFQIPLERDNVFEGIAPPGTPARPKK